MQHWVGVCLKYLHFQKQAADSEAQKGVFPDACAAPIETLLTYRDTLSFWLFSLKESRVRFSSSFPSWRGKLTMTPWFLYYPQPHITDGVSHRGGSTTFHEGKAHTPHQATLHLKHAYQQPRATWHCERQLGNLFHQTPIDFFAASFRFWWPWRHKRCLQ